ncbi:MAG TPA: DUF484 family protein [Rhodocyclaceae bacterium]
MTLRADEVARYLQSNPQFFEEYSQLISQIVIPHPHGGRAISITERQMLALRNRNRELESKLSELIEFGEENDGISEKLHRLGMALVTAADLPVVLEALHHHLTDDFSVPQVSLCLWDAPFAGELPVFVRIDDSLAVLAEPLVHPYCGDIATFDPAAWFGERAAGVRSQALMSLRHGDHTIGLLALGSEDPRRFYPEMGTLYLDRLAELTAAALVRVRGQ